MAKLKVSTFDSTEDARDHHLSKLSIEAESQRPSSPSQEATYEAKHKEAMRYPSGTGFPFLEAEAEALGTTQKEVADSILAARQRWEQKSSRIEAARLKAKRAIRGAETPAEMHRIASAAFKEID